MSAQFYMTKHTPGCRELVDQIFWMYIYFSNEYQPCTVVSGVFNINVCEILIIRHINVSYIPWETVMINQTLMLRLDMSRQYYELWIDRNQYSCVQTSY